MQHAWILSVHMLSQGSHRFHGTRRRRARRPADHGQQRGQPSIHLGRRASQGIWGKSANGLPDTRTGAGAVLNCVTVTAHRPQRHRVGSTLFGQHHSCFSTSFDVFPSEFPHDSRRHTTINPARNPVWKVGTTPEPSGNTRGSPARFSAPNIAQCLQGDMHDGSGSTKRPSVPCSILQACEGCTMLSAFTAIAGPETRSYKLVLTKRSVN